MKELIALVTLLSANTMNLWAQQREYVILVHGGAGVLKAALENPD